MLKQNIEKTEGKETNTNFKHVLALNVFINVQNLASVLHQLVSL